MPAILLVRHGQASFGTADYDRLSDVGRRQALLVGTTLKRQGVAPARVVSGTAERQRESALAGLEISMSELETDSRLDEFPTDELLRYHGKPGVALETPGMSSREFQSFLDAALGAWVESGGTSPAGVTWPAFQARCTAALQEISAGLGSGQTAALFTSAGVIAAIATDLIGGTGAAFVSLNRVLLNASITKVVVGGTGATLISFNEHGHLGAAPSSLLTYR